jgi:prepilin-type processing-associated H-X9-DG protein
MRRRGLVVRGLAAGGLALATAYATAAGGQLSVTAASATASAIVQARPARIVPDPAGPRDEPEVYHNGCHVGRVVTKAHTCKYGDPHGERTMVVFGDSHVAQWFGALTKAARAEHITLYWLTKSACPAVDVSVRVWRGYARYTQCDLWRPRALRKVRRLQPDLVVTASYSFHQVIDGASGRKLHGRQRAKEWRRGVARTLDSLATSATRVVQLRDTARQRVDVPVCLVAHHLRSKRCRTRTSWALPSRLWRIERGVAADHPNVESVDLSRAMCGRVWCRPLAGDVLRWRDDSHLTDTYARRLAPELRPYLRSP